MIVKVRRVRKKIASNGEEHVASWSELVVRDGKGGLGFLEVVTCFRSTRT